MKTEQRRRFLIDFAYFVVLLGLVIFLCRYAIGTILPFLIALVVSLLLKPIVTFLREKCHIHKSIASIVIVLLFYALIVFLVTILGIRIFSACKAFFLRLPLIYTTKIEPWLYDFFDSSEAFAQRLDPHLATAYDLVSSNLTKTLGTTVGSLSQKAVGFVTNFTIKTPGFLLNVLITIIATVFMTVDWNTLRAFVLRQCSPERRAMLHAVKTHLGRTLGSYVRSYALILLITFCELSVGFLIIGIQNPFGVAGIVAVFDILPVVGSGTVLIPWAIICLLQADYMRALGLGILYLIILVIRNIIEPKIIGDHVGLHPLVTLSSMVIGTYVFGPIGLFGLPVSLALVHSLNSAGVIHLYKVKSPDDPSDPPKKPNFLQRCFQAKKKPEATKSAPPSESK